MKDCLGARLNLVEIYIELFIVIIYLMVTIEFTKKEDSAALLCSTD